MSDLTKAARIAQSLRSAREDTPPPTPPACPAGARFWSVALGLGTWTDAESQHLAGCPACQARADRARAAARTPPAASAAAGARTLSADRSLRYQAAPGGRPDPDRMPLVAEPLAFEDPDLRAAAVRDSVGDAWLYLEHSIWPPGTLLHVTGTHPGGTCPPWHAYVLLRPGGQGALARLRLVEPYYRDHSGWCLSVRVVPAACLPADAGPRLHDAFTRATRDDPAAVRPADVRTASAWAHWSGKILREARPIGELRKPVDGIARAAHNFHASLAGPRA